MSAEIPVILLVVLIRLLTPFTVLRWGFAGALLCIAADGSDVVLFEAFGVNDYGDVSYHAADKFFDVYYLSFMVYASLSWTEPLERRTAIFLYLWRLLGIVLYEITHMRQLMFFAPNIFENFYVLVTGARKLSPRFRADTPGKLVIFLLISGVPKLAQEYVMHFLEFPTWPFIRENLLRWK